MEESFSLSKAWKPLLQTLKERRKAPLSKESDLHMVATILNQPFLEFHPHCTCETDAGTALFRANPHHPPRCSLSTHYLGLY